MMKRLITISILAACTASFCWAGDGGTDSPFNMGAGARDIALGGAALTDAGATTATYWNASVLAEVERTSLGAFHSTLYESDVSFQYLGAAVPTVDFGCFGVGVFRLGIGGIEERDQNNMYMGDMRDRRLAFHIGYGRMISGYAVGMSASLENHSIGDYSATSSPGIGISLMRRFSTGANWLPECAASVIGRNIVKPSMKLSDESVSYPYSISAAFSATLVPNSQWHQRMIVSGSITKTDGVDPKASAGLEYDVRQTLFIRGAVRDSKLSFGAGIRYRSLQFDYAMVDRDLGSLHMFSFSAAVGTSVSDKRRIREERREERFNELLRNRLTQSNTESVDLLVSRGKEHLSAGQIEQASILFDRALFMSKSSGMDTLVVSQLASETSHRLERENREREYHEHIDSARVRMADQDHLAAKYFASLALEDMPDSPEAKALVSQADSALTHSATAKQVVELQLAAADSLLSYGKFDEAFTVLKAVVTIEDTRERVQHAIRRVEFERFRDMAQIALDRKDYESAQAVLDSALSRFPQHPWCVELKGRLIREASRVKQVEVVKEVITDEPLSDDLLREVSGDYREGQELFEKGDLEGAVRRWEKVERLAPNYMSVREFLVSAYKFVGIEHYGKGELEIAVETWKKAITLVPDNSEIAGYIKRTENEILKLQELTYEQN